MIGPVLQALWSHWRWHRVQLATLLAGIALATGLWSAVQAINAEARASYDRANAQLGLGQLDELIHPSGRIPLATYVALRRSGWQVAAVLDGRIDAGGRSVRLMGVDMVSYPALPALADPQGNPPAPESVLTPPGRLFATPDLAARLSERRDLPPILTSTALPPDLVLTDIGTAETLLGQSGSLTRLVLLPDQPRARPPLDQVAPDLRRRGPDSRIDTARLTDSFHLNLSAFGLLSFAVGLFIVHGTVGLAFAQRRGMVRTLRALGVPLATLSRLMLAELVVFALIGGTLGLVLGHLLAGALLPDVAATLRGLYGAPVQGQLHLRPGWAAAGLAMAVGGTILASGQALWRLARLPLLAAPGVQAWRRGTDHRTSALTGLFVCAAGIAAYSLFDGLVAGFVLLGGILTGSALLLPMLVSTALRVFGRRARKPVTQWVWADMQAQLPGLSLALMALLLALAANIGVGTMVSSFRLTFLGWLDQRLVSELYVTAEDSDQGRQIQAWLEPRAEAVLPIRNVELPHETGPLFLYGIVDHPTYREHWPLISGAPDAWDTLFRGEGILINEQLARRADLWPGDRLPLAPGMALTIAGVYSDYGNPTGQAIVAMDLFDQIAPEAENRRFGIRIDPSQASPLADALRTRFDLGPGAVVPQAAVKAQSRAIFEKTFVVTSALNVLTLGVAGFAMFTSLLTLWTQRLPQIAPIWALGLTRSRLAALELLRSVVLAALTAFLALPLGLVLAWVLLSVINVQAFGWRLPMFLFPWAWVQLFVLTAIAALLAAALPAWRLRRVPPADLLRVFANER
ncbi:putative ABC transport system permease protein [Ruegeria intermedia]|uniref:Putative ABC transport system permease protein n=1 Tax=Ruegeria intermedia TaxID=996115 RepID=A0A1M4T9K4_9RHOB|nr:FtsX-like permease family protein [Ruegeria intermedia]SHE41090.1 putative ABC transport system permease protein [Ruegeria intermedia]